MNSTNIITSLNVNTQLPLDHKTYVYNENSLLNLGLNQTKAFSYYVGMKVYCVLQNKTYIWREYLTPLELNGLIPNGFIYPNGILNTNYNYSNKKFNFFIYESNNILSTGNISQFVNDVGYITLASLPNGTSLLRQEFTYTGGSQVFTLLNNYSQVYSVNVQGQGALSTSQYNLLSPNQVQILDTLTINDYIVILYGQISMGTNPYYTQSQTDALIENIPLTNTIYKISAENIPSYTPIAIYNNLAYKFDNLNPLHQFSFAGFSTNGTLIGQSCIIQQIGELELLNWNLTPNTQYLASINGLLQIENNSTGFTKVVGYATTANSMQIIKDYTTINK